jgi:voltage-gated potassium channel
MATDGEQVRGARPAVVLPTRAGHPLRHLAVRLVWALAIVVFVALVCYLNRAGYRDSDEGPVTVLDAFYYATVSVTTTGYGDITPVTGEARLLNVLLVTPARVLFLIILVGTTLEVLAARTRSALREETWRRSLKDHVIVCGYGTKGRAAIETLLHIHGDASRIVVIDPDEHALAEAGRAGLAGVAGDAGKTSVLEYAGVRSAAAVVVAANRDDAAVLITLTARELNPDATIVAAVREAENAHLLRQGGADSVIVSAGAAGRLLAHAVRSPQVVEVLEDLLSLGAGLDVVERAVTASDVGRQLSEVSSDAPVLGVVRAGRVLRFDDAGIGAVEVEDRLLCLCSNP